MTSFPTVDFVKSLVETYTRISTVTSMTFKHFPIVNLTAPTRHRAGRRPRDLQAHNRPRRSVWSRPHLVRSAQLRRVVAPEQTALESANLAHLR